jgi:hypothetical protein
MVFYLDHPLSPVQPRRRWIVVQREHTMCWVVIQRKQAMGF